MIISDVGPRRALLGGWRIDTLGMMIDFYEYLSRTQAAWLQPPEKILAKLGISPVPHEIDVQRMVKAMKGRVAPSVMGDLKRYAPTKARRVCSAPGPANTTSQDGRTMPPECTAAR